MNNLFHKLDQQKTNTILTYSIEHQSIIDIWIEGERAFKASSCVNGGDSSEKQISIKMNESVKEVFQIYFEYENIKLFSKIHLPMGAFFFQIEPIVHLTDIELLLSSRIILCHLVQDVFEIVRREEPRIPVSQALNVRVYSESYEGILNDLSISGLSIVSKSSWPKICEAKFKLLGSEIVLQLEKKNENSFENKFRSGFRIISGSKASMTLIKDYIDKMIQNYFSDLVS